MTSLCVDTRGLLRRQDLLFADYLEFLQENGGGKVSFLLRGNATRENEVAVRWDAGGRGNRWWEARFLESGEFQCFHCFRTPDNVPWESPRALVTLLGGPLPAHAGKARRCRLVVPSAADRDLLVDRFDVDPENVFPISPAVRGEFVRNPPRQKAGEKGILFLTASGTRSDRRMLALLKRKHGRLAHFHLDLKQSRPLPLDEWERLLSQTQLAFYLVEDPFDWGTLALECLMRKVPVVYADGNRALAELLGGTGLNLRNYLLEHPEPEDLKKALKGAEESLASRPILPENLAEQFAKLYTEAPVSLRPDLRPRPVPTAADNREEGAILRGDDTTDCSP